MSTQSFQSKRRALLGLALAGSALHAFALEPVREALGRPALAARQPGQSVLLGAAMAGSRVVAVGERGMVLLSDDQGKTWRQVQTPVSVTLTAVRFLDAANGVAVGHGGVVLTSGDGGQHWLPRLDGRKAAAIVLETARASHQEVAIANAERLVADGPDKPFFDVLFLDRKHLMVVGAYGLALESRDGGESWTSWMDRLNNPKGLHYYALRRHGDVFLLAGEQGMVQVSSDGARTFTRVSTPYKGSFFTAELMSAHEMIVAGLRGNVWRSRDGGREWSPLAAPAPVSITGSAVLSGDKLILCNQAGMLLTPEGDGLRVLKSRPMPGMNGLLAVDDRTIAALTGLGAVIMESTTVKQAKN